MKLVADSIMDVFYLLLNLNYILDKNTKKVLSAESFILHKVARIAT